MKNHGRGRGKTILAGAVLAGSLLASDIQEKSAHELREETMATAGNARMAIAGRYASCAIKNVVDMHESTASEIDPLTRKPVTRNRVVITVEATTTEASAKAKARYAEGRPGANLVNWQPFHHHPQAYILERDPEYPDQQYRHRPVALFSKVERVEGNKTTFAIQLTPRNDELRTTSAEISLQSSAETYDYVLEKKYLDIGVTSCGSVVEDTDLPSAGGLGKGPLAWQLGPRPEGIPHQELSEESCDLVPHSTQPNGFTVSC